MERKYGHLSLSYPAEIADGYIVAQEVHFSSGREVGPRGELSACDITSKMFEVR
jgi:hypothetical protein